MRDPNFVVGLAAVTLVGVVFLICSICLGVSSHASAALIILALASPFIFLMLYAWRNFTRVRVETDEMGITLYTLFGKKQLYWFAVEDYGDRVQNKVSDHRTCLFIQGKDGARIYISPDIIGHRELKREIERYAPPPKTGFTKAKAEVRTGRESDRADRSYTDGTTVEPEKQRIAIGGRPNL